MNFEPIKLNIYVQSFEMKIFEGSDSSFPDLSSS